MTTTVAGSDKDINFADVLRELKPAVKARVMSILPLGFPEAHYRIVRDYPEREGKYFRPALTLIGAELFGGSREKAVGVAAAVQLSEEWLLSHDDVEDHSSLRRGKPTLSVLFGDEIAVNAGDTLHILMWRALYDACADLPPAIGREIFLRMNDILLATTEGQFLELSWRREGRVEIGEEEYLEMVERKSARYSVLGPLALGALTAGAGPEGLREMEKWAIPFGIAFQVWDDVLSLRSPAKSSGKRRFEDIREGKRTLMLIHCLAHAESKDRDHLIRIYQKPMEERTEEHERYVVECMERAGSIAYAEMKAKALVLQAEAAFEAHAASLPDNPAKSMVRAAIQFVAARDH